MYVYSQGRRIHRREFASTIRSCSCFQSRQSVHVQTDSLDQLQQVEKLVEESLELWSVTERNLNQSILRGSSARNFRRNDLADQTNGPQHESVLPGFSWTSPRPPNGSKGIQVDQIAGNFQDLRRKQINLRKNFTDLQQKYFSALSRISELEAKIAEGKLSKQVVRRYHFLNNTGLLSSTISKNESSPQTLRQYFYEVRLPLHSSDSPDNLHNHERFTYTETLVADSKGNADTGLDNPEKLVQLLEWLITVQPRTYLDAEPLLILAKDVIHKVGNQGRKLLKSEKKIFEEKLACIKETLERSLEAKEGELQKSTQMFEERIQDLERRHWTQLQEIRQESQDSITYQVTFPMALLRFRNVVMERRNKVLKQRVSDLECRSLLETMLEMSNSDKLLVFQKLFEMESLMSELTPEFFQKSSISEFSKIACSQQILCALEMKHAGRISWINIVSQVLMTTPSNLGRKVLGWYHRELTKRAKLAPDADLDGLEQLTYKNDALYELRDDIVSGKKNIWDAVSTVLQIPKAQAFAEVLGFGPEDDSIVLSLWPDFLVWLEQANRVALAPRDASLQSAIQRLKDSSLWADLQLRSVIRRNGSFDLESIPPATRFSLEETHRLVAEIHCQKEQRENSEILSMPCFVRQFALQRTNLSSSASRFLLRLQSSVKSYYKGNARIRTFARVAGMIHPLRYIDCAERFMRRFWVCIMEQEDFAGAALPKQSTSDVNAGNASHFSTWMAEDRAVEFRAVVVAAIATCRRFLLELPNVKLCPSDSELMDVFLPAVVKVPAGTLLPLKDFEKLGLHSESEQAVNVNGPPLSLDLVSEIMLDLFMKLVREWEESFTALWIGHSEHWDWGSQENSPDLDSLRLFLAKKCNLTLPGPDLVALFTDISDHNDDIKPGDVAKFCFQYLQKSVSGANCRFDASILESGRTELETWREEQLENQSFLYMK